MDNLERILKQIASIAHIQSHIGPVRADLDTFIADIGALQTAFGLVFGESLHWQITGGRKPQAAFLGTDLSEECILLGLDLSQVSLFFVIIQISIFIPAAIATVITTAATIPVMVVMVMATAITFPIVLFFLKAAKFNIDGGFNRFAG
jgi:hypothetical protein